jgi:hypothetical protein
MIVFSEKSIIYSEAFGTSECIPSSQCGNSQSIMMVTMGVALSLLYILFKSSRNETPEGSDTASINYKSYRNEGLTFDMLR